MCTLPELREICGRSPRAVEPEDLLAEELVAHPNAERESEDGEGDRHCESEAKRQAELSGCDRGMRDRDDPAQRNDHENPDGDGGLRELEERQTARFTSAPPPFCIEHRWVRSHRAPKGT